MAYPVEKELIEKYAEVCKDVFNTIRIINKINKKKKAMNNTDVYILLKDLPGLKAGAEYTKGDDAYYLTSAKSKYCVFPISWVENQKDWFQKKEIITGLIGVNIKGNVVNYENSASLKLGEDGQPTAIAINGIIFLPQQTNVPEQPKTEIPITKERIEVKNIKFIIGNKEGFKYEFITDGFFLYEKFPAIKQSIENILNNTNEDEGKEYKFETKKDIEVTCPPMKVIINGIEYIPTNTNE